MKTKVEVRSLDKNTYGKKLNLPFVGEVPVSEDGIIEVEQEVAEHLVTNSNDFEFKDKNFFIIDKGRKHNERAVIKVENGRYMGYGYIDTSLAISNHEELSNTITRFPDNRDVQQIIRSYIRRLKVEKIIKF